MKRLICITMAHLSLVFGCQCARRDVLLYDAVGPGKKDMPCLSLEYLSRYFVYGPPPVTGESLKDMQTIYFQNLDGAFAERPTYASFRSLCAVVNNWFGKWDRLVILERITFGRGGYAFVAVASTSGRLEGITNLELTIGRDWRSEAERLQAFAPDQEAFEDCLAELGRARAVLPEVLLWYRSIDAPVYVLHDMSSDGKTFSFAVSGYEENLDPGTTVSKRADEFAVATQLLKEVHPQWFVSDGTLEGGKLRMAGGIYARLLASVWRSTLGQPDGCLWRSGDTHNRPHVKGVLPRPCASGGP